MSRRLAASLAGLIVVGARVTYGATIEPATDGPKPLSTTESAESFHLTSGFHMELVASEPLIAEPSGVCWDEHGRLHVCELHGYNLEGQYDIDELNQTGQLDREVRRIQANDRAKKAAEAGTYGTVKRLADTNGDGVMDQATLFADRLPPAYGIVGARGGIIVACAPDILFLADRDGDGQAEVRETLFTGFETGALERGINAPQWGVDNWIYLGTGWGGRRITGPRLAGAVDLGRSDFRIRADGTAIEPIPGATHTFGFALTAGGDRFVVSTTQIGLFVAPLPWRSLARNPDVPAPPLEIGGADDAHCFPAAPPHPWRTRRAEDPGFFKFYRDRYGASDSEAGGYFTSTCAPLIYQDAAFPPEFHGQYFVCEPAQNLVHRALIEADGPRLRLRRAPGEERSEFLTSTDPWFHPMNLVHGPDGAIWITDFYREIIEDYSAIPRYLQQQYGLTNGMAHGRLWRLTHDRAPQAGSADLSALTTSQLVTELGSPRFWRRQTARRLLIERNDTSAAPAIARMLEDPAASPAAALNALYALDGLGALTEASLLAAWSNSSPQLKRHALRLADRHFDSIGRPIESRLLEAAPADSADPLLLLQIALSLGESRDPRALAALATLARDHGDLRWMDAAIASSVHRREPELLAALLPRAGQGAALLEMLAAAVAGRGDDTEIRAVQGSVRSSADGELRSLLLRILAAGLSEAPALSAVAADGGAPEPPGADFLAEVERLAPKFTAALDAPRDAARGREVFREHCASCHVSRGLGVEVGPGLDAEFQRAEDAILRDILLPGEAMRPGYETWRVQTRRGETYLGVLASESPTSVTLRSPAAGEFTILRKRIADSGAHPVSLMPASYAQTLDPADVANLIAFLRSAP